MGSRRVEVRWAFLSSHEGCFEGEGGGWILPLMIYICIGLRIF